MLLKNQQQRISEVARKAFTTPTAAYPRLLLPYTLCAYCISLSSFSLLHPNFMMIYFTDGQEQQLSLIQRVIEMLQYIYSRWNMRRNAFTRNDRGGCSNISATTYHLHSKACTYISKYANLAKYEKPSLKLYNSFCSSIICEIYSEGSADDSGQPHCYFVAVAMRIGSCCKARTTSNVVCSIFPKRTFVMS